MRICLPWLAFVSTLPIDTRKAMPRGALTDAMKMTSTPSGENLRVSSKILLGRRPSAGK